MHSNHGNPLFQGSQRREPQAAVGNHKARDIRRREDSRPIHRVCVCDDARASVQALHYDYHQGYFDAGGRMVKFRRCPRA